MNARNSSECGDAIVRARRLALRTAESAFVVWTGETYAVADEFDLDTWWQGAPVIGEVMSDGEYVSSF